MTETSTADACQELFKRHNSLQNQLVTDLSDTIVMMAVSRYTQQSAVALHREQQYGFQSTEQPYNAAATSCPSSF